MIFDSIELVAIDSILIENRQRKNRSESAIADLAGSIYRRSLVQPIVLQENTNKLLVGEGRILAFNKLRKDGALCAFPEYKNWTHIPARFASETLSPADLMAIELEENIHRENMRWQDVAVAVESFHSLMQKQNPTWTQDKTAEALNLHRTTISRIISIIPHMADPQIAESSSLRSASELLSRKRDKQVQHELTKALAVEVKPKIQGTAGSAAAVLHTPSPIELPPESSILLQSFLDWIPDRRFNFVHCDFPYGVNYGDGTRQSSAQMTDYEDTPEVFWALTQHLAKLLPELLMPNSWIFFWFSMNYYSELVEFWSHQPRISVEPFPYIWVKSCNSGMVPDPARAGRRTYETALVLRYGDPKIISPVAMHYSCPKGQTIHPSEKPEPMLRHFFRQFMDEYTIMLDPTCGSASSLRAAESLKAEVLGLEISPEFRTDACTALRKFRILNSYKEPSV